MNPPVTLPTPGKADVEVTILQDRDDYEICFVGEEGFDDLCSLFPGSDFVEENKVHKGMTAILSFLRNKNDPAGTHKGWSNRVWGGPIIWYLQLKSTCDLHGESPNVTRPQPKTHGRATGQN